LGTLDAQREVWLNRAGDFIHSARTLFEASGSAPAPVVLLAWQGVENDFKALSVGHGVRHTHDIGELMNHLRDNNVLNQSDITQLSTPCADVTGSRTYNATRYPETDPGYWSSLPRLNIANAVAGAEHVHSFAKAKIASIYASGTR
jgi:HEPN domain-containing protein